MRPLGYYGFECARGVGICSRYIYTCAAHARVNYVYVYVSAAVMFLPDRAPIGYYMNERERRVALSIGCFEKCRNGCLFLQGYTVLFFSFLIRERILLI